MTDSVKYLLLCCTILLVGCEPHNEQPNCVKVKPTSFVGINIYEKDNYICVKSKGVMCTPKCDDYEE